MQLRATTCAFLISCLWALSVPAMAGATVSWSPAEVPTIVRTIGPSAPAPTIDYAVPIGASTVDPSGTTMCLPSSGSTFADGTTSVFCLFSGIPSNDTGTIVFSVVVNRDTAGPDIAVPATRTVESPTRAARVVTYDLPTATDLAGVAPAGVTCAPASGATFAFGTTRVTCRATDSFGNVGVGRFDVSLVDTTGPVPKVVPARPTDAQLLDSNRATATIRCDETCSGEAWLEGRVRVPGSRPARFRTVRLGSATVSWKGGAPGRLQIGLLRASEAWIARPGRPVATLRLRLVDDLGNERVTRVPFPL